MKANSSARRQPWRVEIALHTSADCNLLIQTLGENDELELVGIKQGGEFSGKADLLILDPQTLRHQHKPVARLRSSAHPEILPVLLLAPNQRILPDTIKHELGHTVEDVLRLPTTGPEIRARIYNLLRLRDMSRQQSREHDLTRQALAGMTRALKTLHACNEVMLRESDEDGLIQAVCRMITQSEGYDLAWVDFVGEGNGITSTTAMPGAPGPAKGYANNTEVYWDDSPWGSADLCGSLATGRSQVIPDLMADPRMAPRWPQIEAWGLKSAVLLPLQTHHGPSGILVVYSRHQSHFENEEHDLLERLANNLAFGLDKLRMGREAERQGQEIRRLAYNDPLTSLPNRRSLLHHLKQIAADDGNHRVAAVLFIDLNDFKLINDALGHAAGDDVLKHVAQRIQHTLREDDLVGRQGGDEFIVVMVDSPRQPSLGETDHSERLSRGAEALAGRIHDSLRQPFDVQGYQHHLGASIGVSLLPYFSPDVEVVIEQADMAMYRAKASGLPLVFYSHDLGNERQKRLALEAELYHAFETEQFLLHYQPIWEINSGRIVGVEALIRWIKDDGQIISPGTFIPLAQETGLIDAIGDWVLMTAARQLATWRRSGINVWMGVNLSVSQLQGREAAKHIWDIVTLEGTDPDWWSLELTEDSLMQAPNEVAEAMHWLSDARFRLSLDDFGQGYSSLARLQSMPLNTLKIDKMFIDRLEEGDAGGRIVSAITELGRHLSLTIVAEGIETEAQNKQLGDIGCHFGQGFLLSAALPAEHIPDLIQQRMQVQPLVSRHSETESSDHGNSPL